MSSTTHGAAPASIDAGRGHDLVLWSFLMLPAYALTWMVFGWLTFALLGPLGLVEGDLLLMAHSALAWVLTLGSYAIIAAFPALGIVLAARALHTPARRAAIVAVVLNAVVLSVTVVQLASEIQLSYWPGIEPWS